MLHGSVIDSRSLDRLATPAGQAWVCWNRKSSRTCISGLFPGFWCQQTLT